MTDKQSSRRIQVLRDDVARKIAAGEVIDRPHAVVRELLDNALDAGAGEIQVHLEAGGLRRIRVVDNGEGMTPSDLELCWLPHATSKIETEDDLLSVTSLGFRGEALASIATVSRLEIISGRSDTEGATRLIVHGGERLSLEPWRGPKGTSVDVAELFFSLPARKKFLKSSSAESAMCRLVLLDRALAFPDVSFRYFTDGELRMFLPVARESGQPHRGGREAESLRQRVLAAFPDIVRSEFLHAVSGSGDGFSYVIVLQTPDRFRNDRRYIQTFVNGRRIWEYAFVQAMEHAFTGYLPGGRYPIAFVFLEVDPRTVDFNIHPAKREARFRNLPDIHHRIGESVQTFLRQHARRSMHAGRDESRPAPWPMQNGLLFGRSDRGETPHSTYAAASWPHPVHDAPVSGTGFRSDGPLSTPYTGRDEHRTYDLNRTLDTGGRSHVRYLGQVLGLFLVAEVDARVLLVDQHAAHERLLFERFLAHGPVQPLLVPLEFALEAEQSRFVRNNVEALKQEGISVEPLSESDVDGKQTQWRLLSIPEALTGTVDFLAEELAQSHASGLVRDLYARMACRSALMDGDPIEPATALTLIEESLKLENPRCPHGRPIWHELSREDLFRFVGRLV